MTTVQKAELLKRLQRLDHEMRTRHYPAVLEDEPRYEDPRTPEQYFLDEQCPSDATFR